MRKLYRSLLWTGVVALTVAACGDDVTVTNPPPPPPPPPPVEPGIRSVTVGPDGAVIQIGGNVQMTAAVTTDPGAAAPSIAWSTSSAATASVSAGGLVTGNAAGTASITATATSGTSTGQGQATVPVEAPPPAPQCVVNSVTATPGSATLVVGQNVQASGAVDFTGPCVGSVTWNALTPAVATVSATGLISAIAGGNAVVTVTSTDDATKSAAIAITVVVPDPATLSIEKITTGNVNVPVVLTAVMGQIEVHMNVDRGDKILDRVEALIGGVVVASQTFTTQPLPAVEGAGGPALGAPVTVTLSTNTAQVKKGSNGLFHPVVFNGQSAITANLYVVGNPTPIASNAVPVVMSNPDAMIAGPLAIEWITQANCINLPTRWCTGGVDWASVNYVAHGRRAVSGLAAVSSVRQNNTAGAACGTSSTTITTGSNLIGLAFRGSWACGNREGAVNIQSFTVLGTFGIGLDGSVSTAATGYSVTGSAFTLGGESRWNILAGPVPGAGTRRIDNKIPTTATIATVAFNAAFDQNWIKANFNIIALISGTDFGVGVNPAADVARHWVVGAPGSCSGAVIPNPHLLAETLTDAGFDAYRACGQVWDRLGNGPRSSGSSNPFGVDVTVPLVRLVGSTGATPSIAPSATATVSALPNTTIYAQPAQLGTQVWGLEGFDNRSGFNQSIVAGVRNDAANQLLQRRRAVGVSNSTSTSSFSLNDRLSVVLSDQWARTPVQTILDNGAGFGYYNYSGHVFDRAGNNSVMIVRNFAYDPVTAPVTVFMSGDQAIYTGGSAAAFKVWGNDDLEVLSAFLSFSFPTMGPPATGMTYPYGSVAGLVISAPWPSSLPIHAIVTSQTISVPYFLARVDESCTAAGVPYATCSAVPGSKPTSGANYNTDLNLVVACDNACKAPTSASTNLTDIAGRDGITGAAFPFSIATPVTPVSQPWTSSTFVAIWTGLKATGSCPTGVICADQQTATSNGLRFFEAVSLWRLDGATMRWTYCGDMASDGGTPQIDNGTFRVWRWRVGIPSGTNACAALGGFFRVLGTKSGAGLMSPSFP